MISFPEFSDLGLFIIRCGLGAVFVFTGGQKLIGGKEKLIWYGTQMQNIGISGYPLLWGCAALGAELFGGISLITGMYMRLMIPLLCFTMAIAVSYHIKHGDSIAQISHPLSYFIVLVGLFFTGSGSYVLSKLL